MRLDKDEKKALKYCLKDFNGDIYLFGSRCDDTKKGGDIDILLLSRDRVNPLKFSLQIQTKFFVICEQRLDVIVYRDHPFYREILKSAKRLDLDRI